MFYRLLLVTLIAAVAAAADIDLENSRSETFKLAGYLDGGFREWGHYNAVPSREFFVRRSGIAFNARLVENLKVEVKVEVRPDKMFLENAFVLWTPTDWIRTQAGQFKTATLLAGELSYWDLNMFERPLAYNLRKDLTFSGRDVGFDMRIDLPEILGVKVRGTAGVFNGDQRGEERIDNELLYTMRGEIEIPVTSANLTLGASAVSHRQGIKAENPSGYSLSGRQSAFSADAALTCNLSNWYSFSTTAEFTFGDNWSLVDVISGEDAPRFKGYWGAFTAVFHPWNVHGIKTFSLAAGYDYLSPDSNSVREHTRLSLIGAIYPVENFRLRFGAVRNTVKEVNTNENYTDLIGEVGIRF
jgi:hypothetical protein